MIYRERRGFGEPRGPGGLNPRVQPNPREPREKRQFAPGGGPPCNQAVLGGPDPPPSTVLLVLGGQGHPPGTMRLLLGGLDSPPGAVRLLLGGLGCLVLPSDLQKMAKFENFG